MPILRDLKREIQRLRSALSDRLTGVIVSREDFRVILTEMIRNEDYAHIAITVDDLRIHSSMGMPYTQGVLFEPMMSYSHEDSDNQDTL